jgi:hypothetical protein
MQLLLGLQLLCKSEDTVSDKLDANFVAQYWTVFFVLNAHLSLQLNHI